MANGDGPKAEGGTEGAHAAPFGLIDVESGNMVGSFRSEQEALLAVAETAREYGADSEAVLTLSLFRDDMPPDQGFIADGEELVRRALDALALVQAALGGTGCGVDRGVRTATAPSSRRPRR